MLKNKWIYFICFSSLMLTGCWDVINVEERGFIIGTAIDIEEGEDEKQPDFKITNQMVIPSGINSPSQGGGDEKSFLNFTAKGKSIYKVDEEISAISSKVPFFEHLEVIIISEDVATKAHLFSNLLDTYIRDVNTRRGIKVVVTPGEAKTLLDFTTIEEKLPAMHIDKLLEHSNKEVGFLKPKRLGDIEEFHLRERSYILPLLEVNEYLEHKAGAVFHGQKDAMVGTFNRNEMQGLEMMETEATEKVIEFTYKNHVFALEVNDTKNKIVIDPSNINEMKITVNITVDGIIKESFGRLDMDSPETMQEIQKVVSEKIKSSVDDAIKKGQGELGADVFNVWRTLEMKHYDTWKKVKHDWEKGENYFQQATFEVKVKTNIFSVGTSNRTD